MLFNGVSAIDETDVLRVEMICNTYNRPHVQGKQIHAHLMSEQAILILSNCKTRFVPLSCEV